MGAERRGRARSGWRAAGLAALALVLEAFAALRFAAHPPVGGFAALLAHVLAALATGGALRRLRARALGTEAPAVTGALLVLWIPVAGLLGAAVMAYAVVRAGRQREAVRGLEAQLRGAPGPARYLPPEPPPEQALQEVLEIEPLADALIYGDPRLRRGAVEALRRLGTPEAVRVLRRALRDPDDEVRTLALAALSAIEGQLSRALQAAEQAVQRAPDDPARYAALGRQHLLYAETGLLDPHTRRRHLELAVTAFGRALERSGERDPELLAVLGRCLLLLHDHERALGFYQRAIEARPDDPELLLGRAQALLRLGQLELAALDFRAALERGLGPPWAEAAAYWAVLAGRADDGGPPPAPPRGFRTPPSGLHRVVLRTDLPPRPAPADPDERRREIEQLLSELARADPRRRQGAYARLLGMRDPDTLRLVAAASQGADEAVRTFVCRYLAELGGVAAAEALVRFLDASEPAVRREAELALERLRPEDAIDPMRDAMGRLRRPEARAALCRLLARTRSPAALQPLLEALRDPEPAVRREAALGLRQLGDRRAVGGLLAVLVDEDEGVRHAAVSAVGALGPAPAARVLMRLVREDPSARVRRTAVWALARTGGRAALQRITEVLRADADASVRLEAMRRLARSARASAARALVRAHAFDAEPEIRAAAAHLLDAMPPEAAARALIAALRDPAPRLRRAAAVRLGQRAGAAVRRALLQALRTDPHPAVRAAAAEGLGAQRGEPDARIERALREAALEPHPLLGYAAALALWTQAARGGLERLDALAADEELTARLAAPACAALLLAAARLHERGHAVPPALMRLARRSVRAEAPDLALAAAQLLGNSRHERDLDALLDLALRHRVAAVREAALGAASQLGALRPEGLLRRVADAAASLPRRRALLLVIAGLPLEAPRVLGLFGEALEAWPELELSALPEPDRAAIERRLGAHGVVWLRWLLGPRPTGIGLRVAPLVAESAERGWLRVGLRERGALAARLRPELRSGAPAIRAAVARVLGALEDEHALPDLLAHALDDTDAAVREAARWAVRRIVGIAAWHRRAG
ncbi:MAG: hypothetical protein D6776_03345 [Planctomycetota bacterium]|nr:MAG: hypothetical protein D6776_03345 [Planctomycetota bacterium]